MTNSAGIEKALNRIADALHTQNELLERQQETLQEMREDTSRVIDIPYDSNLEYHLKSIKETLYEIDCNLTPRKGLFG